MKHAGADALRELEPLLVRLRGISGLVERKPGTFYLRSSAFLHFHEDPAGVFVDVKLNGSSFERRLLGTTDDQLALIEATAAAVESATRRRSGP